MADPLVGNRPALAPLPVTLTIRHSDELPCGTGLIDIPRRQRLSTRLGLHRLYSLRDCAGDSIHAIVKLGVLFRIRGLVSEIRNELVERKPELGHIPGTATDGDRSSMLGEADRRAVWH